MLGNDQQATKNTILDVFRGIQNTILNARKKGEPYWSSSATPVRARQWLSSMLLLVKEARSRLSGQIQCAMPLGVLWLHLRNAHGEPNRHVVKQNTGR